jgi:hypothetical protein
MRAAFAVIAVAALGLAAPAARADTRGTVVKEGVQLTIFRAADRAVVCLSTRPPVHLSGEFGIHASWSASAASPQSKPVELYSKQDYFATPLRLELPLPRQARVVRVEVGACIADESCDAVELNYDLRRLRPSAEPAPVTCRR